MEKVKYEADMIVMLESFIQVHYPKGIYIGVLAQTNNSSSYYEFDHPIYKFKSKRDVMANITFESVELLHHRVVSMMIKAKPGSLLQEVISEFKDDLLLILMIDGERWEITGNYPKILDDEMMDDSKITNIRLASAHSLYQHY